jgi:hypothetical protein
MSMLDRGAQFSPFAALTGYDAAIREAARLTDSAAVLDDSAQIELDEKLRLLQNRLSTSPAVTIVYFSDDKRKAGGSYCSVSGNVRKIDSQQQLLILADGTGISFSQIYEIYCELFDPLICQEPEMDSSECITVDTFQAGF